MLKDSKFSSHLLHLSQLQIINHKTLDEYRDRLKTYEDYLWFGKPDQISAIECSRRGWACQSNDLIECVNCHAQILAQLPSVLKKDAYMECIENISQSLVNSHHRYCVWKFMIIPESIVQLTDIYSNETVNRLLKEAEEFLSHINQIDIVGQLQTMFQIEATDFDLLSSSYLNDSRLLSAFKIRVFCWKFNKALVICDKCCREIHINMNHLIFDPILSHRAWCPVLKNNQWKKRIEQIENILYKKSRNKISEIKTNNDQTENILPDIISTQNLFHELISKKLMSTDDKRYFQRTLHYFPSIENDASRITWAHAVNSREKLEEALKSSLMFIEADILIGSSSSNPIMAHPPHKTSDLTFSDFLNGVKSTSKGLKLDFKDINALQPCLNELEVQKDNINGPIILNADIVRANPQCAQPIDAQRFLSESLTFAFRVIPQLMISFSLGWTTIYDKTTNSYTWSSVINMYRTITQNDNYSLFNFEITFPVRLSLALKSFDQLHWLAQVTKSGLTFWSPINEVENTKENFNRLLQFRTYFNRSLIYYDLPPPFDSLINENFYTQNERESGKDIFPSMKDNWHTTTGQEDNVLVSDFNAVLLKSNVFLRTKQTFDSTVACTWSGTIDFLTDASSQTQAVLCYLAETEHTSKAGMTITISKTGSIEVLYENSQGSSQVDENFVFPSYAYAFRIRDSISTIHIEILSLDIENVSLTSSTLTSVPTSVQLTVFLNTNHRRITSSDENKHFHAAVVGQNIEQITSTDNNPTGGIVFSRLRLTQESLCTN
ncbi:unnamed protein product [Rotaria sp. Silwood2]|nr:unnamed protein product [Rotaria sp. Silwood2]CAF4197537.1 unnamed protein product [Rotaria sp. Silwood2]